MPGLGRTEYWWGVYEKERRLGATKQEAAIAASRAERKHRAKRKKNR